MHNRIETSIVIPAYNCENFICLTIASCARQSAPGISFEIVVVNDGSTDRTRPILHTMVKQLPRGFLRVVDQDNHGAGDALNYGIDQARGPNIIVCDADDRLSPSAVDLLTKALKDSTLVTGEQAVFDHGTGKIIYVTDRHGRLRKTDKAEEEPLLHACIVGNPRAFKKRDFTPIPQGLRVAQDYALALSIAFPGDIKSYRILPHVLYWYRKHRGSISVNNRELQTREAEAAVTAALHRLGISARGKFVGRKPPGFLHYDHVPLTNSV